MKRFIKVFIYLFLVSLYNTVLAEPELNYYNNNNQFLLNGYKTYIIDEIKVEGNSYTDNDNILFISGLNKNDIISNYNTVISDAIKNLYKNGFEANIYVDKVVTNKVSLVIKLIEVIEITDYNFDGIGEKDIDNITDKLNLNKGDKLNDSLLDSIKTKIINFFRERGYPNTTVYISVNKGVNNKVSVNIKINKGDEVIVRNLVIRGNKHLSKKIINSLFVNTPIEKKKITTYNIIKKLVTFKFISNDSILLNGINNKAINNVINDVKSIFYSGSFSLINYEKDKNNLLNYYNSLGYINATVKDEFKKINDNIYDIYLDIDEGDKFYIGDIKLFGNFTHSNKELNDLLGISKGEVYDRNSISQKIDLILESIYIDKGYLFSDVNIVEAGINGNLVSLEFHITESEKATINKVTIKGNTYTDENIIRRELLTLPGDNLVKSRIRYSLDNLARLDIFDISRPDIFEATPSFDSNNMIDLIYNIKEKMNAKINLGASLNNLDFNLGLNNFSLRKLIFLNKYKSFPVGSGQSLGVTIKVGKNMFKDIAFSFSDPWIGYKKRYSFSVDFNTFSNDQNVERNDRFNGKRFNIRIGKSNISWLDRYSSLYLGVNTTFYDYKKLEIISEVPKFNGKVNDLSFTLGFFRNSTDSNFYPTKGAMLRIQLISTLPYSWFSKSINIGDSLKINKINNVWLEYNKIKVNTSYFFKVVDKLVLGLSVNFGALGSFSPYKQINPFNRFVLGEGKSIIYDNIAIKGYENESFPNDENYKYNGGVIYEKFGLELRYPVSSIFYLLCFLEASNCWREYVNFNPFSLNKSYGVGGRIVIPVIGEIGLYFAFGMDNKDANMRNSMQFNFDNGDF